MKKVTLGKTFSEKVIDLARQIPKGKVLTYGDLAKAAGAGPLASRSVNSILVKAERVGVKDIPFHRIVYASGKVWVNDSEREKRLKLYKKEGIIVDEKDKILNFTEVRLIKKEEIEEEGRDGFLE